MLCLYLYLPGRILGASESLQLAKIAE